MSKDRVIQPVEIISEPVRVSTATRLKPDDADQLVLEALGSWYAQEFLWVFKQRNELGTSFNKEDRARLKRELTARGMSSRWAGALLGEAMQTWRLGRVNSLKYIQSLQSRIRQIEYRLKPTNSQPYKREEHWFKYQRLTSLRAKLAQAQTVHKTGKVKHVRGGHKLLKNRLNLEASKFESETEWRGAWMAARERSFQAPGEGGKIGGNETIRLTPEGYIQIKLPDCLAHLSNASHGRYQLNQPVSFTYRNIELQSALTAQQSIAYRVRYDSEKTRWYMDATFKASYVERETDIKQIRTGNIIGVDLNKAHASIAIANPHGNLICKPFDIPFKLEGVTKHRDAQVRHLITQLIKLARQYHASIAIEDLDFESEKTLSKGKYSKQFRSTLHAFPVSIFRLRLQGMTATAGIPLIAVDPAYTSKWGKAYWQEPLNLSTHQAAAFMITRRAYKYCLKRKTPLVKQSKNKGLTDSDGQTLNQGEPQLQSSFDPSIGSSSDIASKVHQVERTPFALSDSQNSTENERSFLAILELSFGNRVSAWDTWRLSRRTYLVLFDTSIPSISYSQENNMRHITNNPCIKELLY